ncbi:MAG: hypothetical protein QNK23_02020 [Crocinitomicaceae bacterium]|nr:hypothetical protein [Crocinitomicaceae bacterium]
MTNLAPYNRVFRLFTPAGLIVIYFCVAYKLIDNDWTLILHIAVAVFLLWFYVSRWLRTNTYLFDQQVLHIINKRSKRIVPLEKIVKIKLRLDNWKFVNQNFQRYTVEYVIDNKSDISHFWVASGTKAVFDFEKAVKAANPDTVVEHWEDDDTDWSEMYKRY